MSDESRERINRQAGAAGEIAKAALGIDWYDTESQARRVAEYAQIQIGLAEERVQNLMHSNASLRFEYGVLEADRDAADEAGATNAEERVRLAGQCDSLRANIRYAGQVLDKITAECAAHAGVEKPAEIAYAMCYIRALAHNARLDLGLAVGSQGEPILRRTDSASGSQK